MGCMAKDKKAVNGSILHFSGLGCLVRRRRKVAINTEKFKRVLNEIRQWTAVQNI